MGIFGETRVKHSGKLLRHFAPKCTDLHLHIICHNPPKFPKLPYFRPFPTLFQVELEGTGVGLWAPFVYGEFERFLGIRFNIWGNNLLFVGGDWTAIVGDTLGECGAGGVASELRLEEFDGGVALRDVINLTVVVFANCGQGVLNVVQFGLELYELGAHCDHLLIVFLNR